MKYLRAGRSWGRTLIEYDSDAVDDNFKGRLIGMVDTPELAIEIVVAVNASRARGRLTDDEMADLTDLPDWLGMGQRLLPRLLNHGKT